MDDNAKTFLSLGIVFEILDGACFAVDQGVHGLQMTRVRQDRQPDRVVAALHRQITGHPQMVLLKFIKVLDIIYGISSLDRNYKFIEYLV